MAETPNTRDTLRALYTFLAGLRDHCPGIGETDEFWKTVDDLRWRVEVALGAETKGHKMQPTERARLLWQYLIRQAAQRKTVSYAEAAEAIGYRGPRALGAGQYGVMGRVYDYCKRNGLPILTAIVVYSDGCPNEQYTRWPVERNEVWNYEWSKIPVPPESEFGL